MRAVRAAAGEAILMHHQTVHGVGPNHSDTVGGPKGSEKKG